MTSGEVYFVALISSVGISVGVKVWLQIVVVIYPKSCSWEVLLFIGFIIASGIHLAAPGE